MLGLGADAVVHVRTDAAPPAWTSPTWSRGCARLRVDAVCVPMAVVATAGTTDFGAVDPLDGDRRRLSRATASGCTSTRAYGGGLHRLRRHRHLLDGIELADSVTVDFHKTFFQPVSSSAVLVRERPARWATSTYYADYLNPARARHRRRSPEPGGQEPPDHPPLRRPQALADPCASLGADAIGALFDDVDRPRRPRCGRCSTTTPTSSSLPHRSSARWCSATARDRRRWPSTTMLRRGQPEPSRAAVVRLRRGRVAGTKVGWPPPTSSSPLLNPADHARRRRDGARARREHRTPRPLGRRGRAS